MVSEYLKEHIGNMFTIIEDVVIEKNIADRLTKAAENRDVVGNVDNQADRKFFLKMFLDLMAYLSGSRVHLQPKSSKKNLPGK